MSQEDIIDGLRVIARRRGQMICQGDVLIVQAAIKEMMGRSEYCSTCKPRPLDPSSAAAGGSEEKK